MEKVEGVVSPAYRRVATAAATARRLAPPRASRPSPAASGRALTP
jgi:hypothetical protein